MLSLRLGTQTETRNLDKSDSAMLSALPPGSSTPLCSHLFKLLPNYMSGFISLIKATKITLNQSHFKSRFASGFGIKKRFASPRKFLIRRVEHLVCITLLSCKIKYSGRARLIVIYIHIYSFYEVQTRKETEIGLVFRENSLLSCF